MAHHVRGAVSAEVDTDALFEKYEIEQIREIEKKTRQDIERKKEDLRIMVGERYRELIEAADTISEMKNSAHNVMHSIGRIQEMCQDLRQTFQAKTFSSLSSKARRDVQGKKEDNQFYSLATQIKLLMDMPEKIWSATDAGHYLRATQLFLLARHVNTGLQLGSHHAGKVHSWFPVLTRQWAAISHFRPTILQTCRQVLRDVDVADTMTAECLCSILLLEDSTPRQVFSEFLLARSTAVTQQFQSDQTSSIKTQICGVVKTIVTTIHQIYTIFYDGKDTEVSCNLLMKILSDVTDKSDKGEILGKTEGSISARYMSKVVLDYRPELQQHATSIQLPNLQENCLQWIDTCKTSVKSGLSKLLGFITTVKGLAAIRDEVWTLLQQDENMKTWDSVCEQVAKQTLKIWDQFFRPHFMERTKSLLQAHFDNALSMCTSQVGKVLVDIGNWDDRVTACERNLANYVWTEGPRDIPANTAWVPIGAKTLLDGGGLMMKARSYTPAVQGLSRSFDSKIKILLEDGNYYLKHSQGGSTEEGPFDRFADHNDIQNFLETACQDSINKLNEHLKQLLADCQKQLDTEAADPRSCRLVIDRVLLLGRFCMGLCELSPHLMKCMTAISEQTLDRPIKKVRGQSKSSDNPKWSEMKGQLLGFSQESFRMWSNYMSKNLVSQFRTFLLDNSNQALLRACTKWDEIQIEEETEEGQKVKSTIQVPMQVSWYVQSLLYDLCEEINRIGGHALPRKTLVTLVEQLTDGIMEAYEYLLASSAGEENTQITQNRALQLIFDIRALMNTLPRKDEAENNRQYQEKGQALVKRLESQVDPFDLDVFMPHINNHLMKQSQRSNILYGSLTFIDRHATYMSSGKQSSVQQEQHNVLPLTTSGSRIPLLPLSVQNRTSMSQPIIQSPKPITKGPMMSPSGLMGASSPPPMLSPPHDDDGNTSSFFGQMSTIWFSNVGKKN